MTLHPDFLSNWLASFQLEALVYKKSAKHCGSWSADFLEAMWFQFTLFLKQNISRLSIVRVYNYNRWLSNYLVIISFTIHSAKHCRSWSADFLEARWFKFTLFLKQNISRLSMLRVCNYNRWLSNNWAIISSLLFIWVQTQTESTEQGVNPDLDPNRSTLW